MSRLSVQLNTIQAIEAVISKAGKVVITPTRISIKSELKVGKEYYAQVAAVNKVIHEQGMLPFTVEIVAHG